MVQTLKTLRQTFFLLPLFFVLTGCWDRTEIDERAVVLGVGVDAAKAGEMEEERAAHLKPLNKDAIKITVQIAVPGRIPLGPGGGEGGGTYESSKAPVWVLDAVGHSLEDAFMNLQQKLADELFFGHLRVVVISEDVARKGIANINDYMRRNPQIRRTTWIIVSKNGAAGLMRASPELERVPTSYLLEMMEHAVGMGKLPTDFAGVFWSASSALGKEPFLPLVELKKREYLRIEGLAIFRGDRMVAETGPLEIAWYMALTGTNPAGYSVVVQLPEFSSSVMFRATKRIANTKVDIVKGKPRFRIQVFVEGNITEKWNNYFKIREDRMMKRVEEELKKLALKEYREFIRKTQAWGTDIFGLGEHLRAREPGFWDREIRTKEKWQKMYRNVQVDVELNFKVRRVGARAA